LYGIVTQTGKNRQPSFRVKGEVIDTARDTRQRHFRSKYECRTFSDWHLRHLLRDAGHRKDRERRKYGSEHSMRRLQGLLRSILRFWLGLGDIVYSSSKKPKLK